MNDLATFHIWQHNQSSGPFTVRELRDKLKAGSINNATLVARSGDEDWLPLSTYGDILTPASVEGLKEPSVQGDPAIETMEISWGFVPPLLAVAGLACMLYFGFFYKITVGGDEPSNSWHKTTAVNNVGLMSDREAGMVFGAALFIGGCALASGRK